MTLACSNIRWLAAICAYAAISLSIAIVIKCADSSVGDGIRTAVVRRMVGADVAAPALGGKDATAMAALRFEGLARAILARNESKGGESLELPQDYFNVFDDVSCQGPFPSVAQAKEELKRSMRAPPLKVIEAMEQQGISEKQTTSKTFRGNLDRTPVLSSASYYLAAVHTTFEPKAATYSVCAAVTAIEFKPTLALHRYADVVHREIDGEEDCHCWLSSCSRCALLRPRAAQLPEFRPAVVSPEQQRGLGSWLETRVANLILESLSSHIIV